MSCCPLVPWKPTTKLVKCPATLHCHARPLPAPVSLQPFGAAANRAGGRRRTMIGGIFGNAVQEEGQPGHHVRLGGVRQTEKGARAGGVSVCGRRVQQIRSVVGRCSRIVLEVPSRVELSHTSSSAPSQTSSEFLFHALNANLYIQTHGSAKCSLGHFISTPTLNPAAFS